MAGNKIQLKRTSVAGRLPSNLDVGELAINLVDNRLFTADGSNTIIDVHGQSLNTTANVTFRDGAFANITSNTIGATTITGNLDWSYITSKPDLKIDITGDATGNQTFTDLANGSISVTLASTNVAPGTYGNSSAIPVITVDAKGRVTSATTNTVAGVTGFAYTTANNTLTITTGAGSTYSANINTITAPTISNANLTGTAAIAAISANGSLGTAGQILSTNGTAVYWNNAPATSLDAVLAVGNTTTKSLTVGPLTVGTGNTALGNTTITGSANVTTTMQVTGAATFSNSVSIAGNLTGTAANVTIVAGVYSTIFANNGTTTFPGGVSGITTLAAGNTSITGNLTVTSGTTSLGNTVISGNLIVTGSTTYVNTNIFQVSDNIITLNADAAGTPTDNVGFEVNRGTSANVALLWDESIDKWTFTNDGTTYYNIPTQAGTNAFSTIAVAGQTDVVADSVSDTLTFANGVGISIATDPVTDTITITNTGTGANSFGTYVFANASAPQPNIVANAAYSTLNMVAGNNVDFSVLSNNTLIISASGTGGGGGGASGALMRAVDSFTGNGTNTVFTLSTVANSSTAFVMVDGLVYQYTDDYSISNTTLTFTSAPLSSENIRVYHFNMVADPGNSLVVDEFVGNGSNTNYTSSRIANTVSCFVTVDGIVQSYTNDYTFTADLLTFTTAPLTGEIINIHHIIGSHATGFNKIVVAGQANVNATRVESAVVLEAGAGMTITTTSDTVTFSQSSITKQSLTGNGSNTTFTLSTSTTADNILVYVNGVYQHPDEDYSVSGTTLSFGVAPTNTAKIRIRHVR